MQTFYPADRVSIAKLPSEEASKFEVWIDELESILTAHDDKHIDGGAPYGLPLAQTTGLDCWLVMYNDGMSPTQAFDADRECWDYE